MDLQAIGHSGQPTREVFRPVEPPRTVLIDLATLFPRQPHQRGQYTPMGLQMHSVAEGKLTCWVRPQRRLPTEAEVKRRLVLRRS
jgi:hypothetical protein